MIKKTAGRVRKERFVPKKKTQQNNTYRKKSQNNQTNKSKMQDNTSFSRVTSIHPVCESVIQLPQVKHLVIDDAHVGQRLDNFLISQLKGVPKTYIYRIIRSGEVRINKGRAQADTRIQNGDVIRIPPVRLPQKNETAHVPAKEFPILFEDNSLLVVNKPDGTAVHGGSGIDFGLIEQLRRARPHEKMLELVHRLDKETSGVILIAKKRSSLTALQQQFRERETGKTYLALVKGVWQEEGRKGSKVIDLPLHKYVDAEGQRWVKVSSSDNPLAKRSVSVVRLVQAFDDFSLLAVTIKTGRTHQIRVHLAHLGHPIIGDEKYGDFELNREFAKKYHFSRMFLHAYELSFEHPHLEKPIQLQAPLPLECQKLLEQLGLVNTP